MKYKIIFSENAKRDLISIVRYISAENYLVFYIPDESNKIVKIYRVIYRKRDMENQLKDRVIF